MYNQRAYLLMHSFYVCFPFMTIGTSMVVHKACIEKAKDVGGELDKFLLYNLTIDVT